MVRSAPVHKPRRFPVRFFADDAHIPFMRYRRVFFLLSLALSIATFALLATRGLTMGIDFTGGVLIEVRAEQPVALAPLRKALQASESGEVSLQHAGQEIDVLIRVQHDASLKQTAHISRIKQTISGVIANPDFRQIEYVGPAVGEELMDSAIYALGLSIAAMLVYVWLRFEWQFGLGGIIALVHDAVMIVGFYALTGYEFTLTSVAAILTIIGYSINDSVVIYDRIRENMQRYKRLPLPEIINNSINETLSRTVLTAGTTALAALMLFLFGGAALESFSAALLFGVVFGTYSSIFISAPILISFSFRQQDDVVDADHP